MADATTPRDIVLLVDDSPDTLGFLTEALEQSGFSVLIATSGQAALSIVERITPDLILLDAVMPGMATPAQMEELRSLEREPADILYLQLMTTHHIAGVDMAQAALDGGVVGEVRRLSAAMVNGQEAEMDLMTDMLHARDAQTLEGSGEHADD